MKFSVVASSALYFLLLQFPPQEISGAVFGTLLAVCPTQRVSVETGTKDDAARSQLDELFRQIPHATFEWSAAEGVSNRAAILIPVNIDGSEGWLQLDTGLDVTLLYGDIMTARDWEEHDGMYHVPGLTIGEMRLGPVWVRSRPETPAKGGMLGSLGLDLLVGRTVLIDYPGRRFALMEFGEMPAWLLERVSWTPATLRDAKFFPYVIIGGTGVSDLFYDTGASAFSIIVDRDRWSELTGCSDPESAATRQTVNSWGNPVTVMGAPALGPLTVGSVKIEGIQVFHIDEQPSLFEQWPFPTSGLLGNAAFWEFVVILDLGIRPRLGVVK